MRKLIAMSLAVLLIFAAPCMVFAVATASDSIELDTAVLDHAQLTGIGEDGSIELCILQPQGLSRNGYPTITEVRAKIIPLTEKAKADFSAAVTRATNKNYRELADDSRAVTLYSTTEWETKATARGNFKRLTRFYGGIKAAGSGAYISGGVSIVQNMITYGAYGWSENDGYITDSTDIHLSTSTRSFSYSRTSAWINATSPREIGHNYLAGLKRGSSIWYTELTNNA